MSFGTQNLGEGLLWVAIFVAVVSTLTAVAVWLARRRKSTTVVLDAAAGIARAWLAIVVLGVALVVWRAVSADDVWIDALPARLNWASQPTCGGTGTDPFLDCADVDAVSATIVGLPLGIRVLLGLSEILTLSVAALPSVLVLVLTGQTRKGNPFTRTASRAFAWTAVALLVLGTTTDLVTQIARSLAANAVLPTPESGAELTSQGIFYLMVPLWPAAAAVALAALAVVFRYGSALQTQTEALRRDTEGLV